MISQADRAEAEFFIRLLQAYRAGELSPGDLQEHYIKAFKETDHIFEEETFEALNDLFIILENYCDDPNLFDEGDTTEGEIAEGVRRCLDLFR